MAVDQEQDLVTVINRVGLVENLLNQVIEEYCAPRSDRRDFFWDVVLNSAVMAVGAKTRVVSAVAQSVEFKLDTGAIHRVMALRNAFAHHPTHAHPVLVVGKTPDEDIGVFELHVLTNSGRIERTRRHEALDQFNNAYSAAKASLLSLRDTLRSGSERR